MEKIEELVYLEEENELEIYIKFLINKWKEVKSYPVKVVLAELCKNTQSI